jgi:hypothetical protein
LEALPHYGGCHVDDAVSNFSIPYEISRSEWLKHNMASKSESQDDWSEVALLFDLVCRSSLLHCSFWRGKDFGNLFFL